MSDSSIIERMYKLQEEEYLRSLIVDIVSKHQKTRCTHTPKGSVSRGNMSILTLSDTSAEAFDQLRHRADGAMQCDPAVRSIADLDPRGDIRSRGQSRGRSRGGV